MISNNYNEKIESDYLLKDFISFVNELAKGNNADIKFPFDEYQNQEHDIFTVCHNFNRKYLNKLNSFSRETIEKINDYMSQILYLRKNLNTQFNILSDVSHVIEMIEEAFHQEFTGYPSLAFECIENIMCNNNCHLLNLLPQLDIGNNALFYRVRRESEDPITKRTDLFHVPFEERVKCDTYRYSTLGYPSLYLANSLLTSLKECNFDNPKNYFCSCFKSTRELTFVDLSYSAKATDFTEKYSFIVFYPLIVSCSQKVREPIMKFKPEYIIPQHLFQVIRLHNKTKNIDGITYTSTKYDDVTFTNESRRNFVMYIRDSIKEKGYSEELAQKLISTKPRKCLSDISLSEINCSTLDYDDIFSD